MSSTRKAFFLFLIIGVTTPLLAEEVVKRAEYVQKVLELDPELSSTKEEHLRTQYRKRASLANWLPSLSAGADTNLYGHNPLRSYAREDPRFAEKF